MVGLGALLIAGIGLVVWGLFSLIRGYKSIKEHPEGEAFEKGKKQIRTGIIIFIGISAFLIIGFSTCLAMIGGGLY